MVFCVYVTKGILNKKKLKYGHGVKLLNSSPPSQYFFLHFFGSAQFKQSKSVGGTNKILVKPPFWPFYGHLKG